MKILISFFAITMLTLAHAVSPAPVYTQDDYLAPAKQFLRDARLGEDEFALVLVSLVDRETPQVFTLRTWRLDELQRGVEFDASNSGVTFAGHFRAKIEGNGKAGAPCRIAGEVLLDVPAKTFADGSSVDGIRAEARVDHPFARRQIRVGGGSAIRSEGARSGVQLFFVRGG